MRCVRQRGGLEAPPPPTPPPHTLAQLCVQAKPTDESAADLLRRRASAARASVQQAPLGAAVPSVAVATTTVAATDGVAPAPPSMGLFNYVVGLTLLATAAAFGAEWARRRSLRLEENGTEGGGEGVREAAAPYVRA